MVIRPHSQCKLNDSVRLGGGGYLSPPKPTRWNLSALTFLQGSDMSKQKTKSG